MVKRKRKPKHKLREGYQSKIKRYRNFDKKDKHIIENNWVETCQDTKQNTMPKTLPESCRMVAFISRVELVNAPDDEKEDKNEAPVALSPLETHLNLIKTDGKDDRSPITTAAATDANVDIVEACCDEDTKKIESPLVGAGEISCPSLTVTGNSEVMEGETTNGITNAGKTLVKETDESGIKHAEKVSQKCRNEKNKDCSRSFIIVVHTPSAKKKLKMTDTKLPKRLRETTTHRRIISHLPNVHHGDKIIDPNQKDVSDKHWARRKCLFSRFDFGIIIEGGGWNSVPPQAIANHTAARIARSKRRRSASDSSQETKGVVVLDAFCGYGGNAIALARQRNVGTVICVDHDRTKLRAAAHNASVYKIDPSKIVFVEADAVRVMEGYKDGRLLHDGRAKGITLDSGGDVVAIVEESCKEYTIGGTSLLPSTLDAIFLSPPLGGGMRSLNKGQEAFDVSKLTRVSNKSSLQSVDSLTNTQDKKNNDTIDGEKLLLVASRAAYQKNIVYDLPRSVNGVSLGRLALKVGYTGRYELQQNVLDGKLESVTAYFHENLDKPR